MLMPKKYEAEVELMVDQGSQTQPSITSEQDLAVADLRDFSRPRNIATQVEQLQSLGVLTTAAKAVAADTGESDPTLNPNSPLNPINLQKSLNITADQTSDMIDFTVRMPNANGMAGGELAQRVAEAIYTAFVKQNEANSKELAQRAITSLEAQSRDISNQLKDIDKKSNDLRKKTDSPDITGQVTSEVSGLEALKQLRDTAQIEAAGAKETVEVLSAQLATMPKMVAQATTTTTNPVWEKLEGDLITAQGDRATIAAQFLPGSDQLRGADDKIKSIKSELAALKHDVPAQSVMGLNQNYLALEAQLATAKAASKAADGKVAVANQQVTDREKDLDALPDIQTQLATLGRQQLALEKVYAGYQDSLKSLQAAKEGRQSPTQEITPATAFPEPVSPKPGVNMLFGALVGLLLGIASMQFAEAKRQPVRSLPQLNGLAMSPVYRIIPELREPFRGLNNAPPEAFESLLLNYLRSSKRPYRVAVVGINKDSGASITALNMAVAGERHGSKVLYVQCDAKGALSRVGHKDLQAGSEVKVSTHVKAIAATSVLDVSGQHSGIASSVHSREADLTVIDLEPTTRSAEYAFVAPLMDEVILLVRAGRARSVEFLQAQQALRDAGCPKITVVFTRSSDFSVVVDAIDPQIESKSEPALPEYRVPVAEPVVAAQPVEVAPVVESVKAAPVEAQPVWSRPAEVEPVSPVAPELKVETTPEPGDENVIQLPQKKMNGTDAQEGPVRRQRTSPTVNIEDFGGITRAKPIVQPEEPKDPTPRSRRSTIDTSDIDS
jgi:uncharacterized protein involved in exopolysaccharide biosynthesis